MKKREILLRSRLKLDLVESYEMFLRLSMMNVSSGKRLTESEIALLSYVWSVDMVINRDIMREHLNLKSAADLNNRINSLTKRGYLDNSLGKGIIKVRGSWNLPKDFGSLKLGFIIDVINRESEGENSQGVRD